MSGSQRRFPKRREGAFHREKKGMRCRCGHRRRHFSREKKKKSLLEKEGKGHGPYLGPTDRRSRGKKGGPLGREERDSTTSEILPRGGEKNPLLAGLEGGGGEPPQAFEFGKVDLGGEKPRPENLLRRSFTSSRKKTT